MIIVLEGIDGSGKTTISNLLQQKLLGFGYKSVIVHWHSFLDYENEQKNEVFSFAKKAKNLRILNPLTFTLLHCADFAYRWETVVTPSLKNNHIVLMDRYIYTPIVRDCIRGIDKGYLKEIYSFVNDPDIIFFLETDPENAYERIVSERNDKVGFYEAGQDINKNMDIKNSFIKFQSECISGYRTVLPNGKTININTSLGISNTINVIISSIFSSESMKLISSNLANSADAKSRAAD